jgi:hypothetical protein
MSEVLFMASVLLLLIGAMGFYFYTRILYTEKKINLLETILLDIKMMLEMEDLHQPSNSLKYNGAPKNAPIEETIQILEPENLEKTDTEELKDETAYYNSVIESVASESVPPDTNTVANAVVSENYDTLSRDELVALAEKKGLKVTKRTQRQTIINLLRESEKNSSGSVELGKDGATGPFTSMGERGAPLDMGNVEEVGL